MVRKGAIEEVKLRFVACVNFVPQQSAQVIIQCGTRYVDFFLY